MYKRMGSYLSRPLTLSVLEALETAESAKHERSRNRCRDRGYALGEVDELSDSNFSTMFRMNREGFEDLLSLIGPFMHETNETMAKMSSGSIISKRTRLHATLRWLA